MQSSPYREFSPLPTLSRLVWEYQVKYVSTGSEPHHERRPLELECQSMGRAGWELVGVARSATGKFYHLFFKRPTSVEAETADAAEEKANERLQALMAPESRGLEK